jgi:hypothetical protein
MYNTEVICTYNSSDVFLDTDNITENEKQFIRNVIYRQELLNILYLDDFDDVLINEKMYDIYKFIKDYDDFKICIKKILTKYNIINDQIGFYFLFSFDYLEETHKCISEYILSKTISRENIENLINKII